MKKKLDAIQAKYGVCAAALGYYSCGQEGTLCSGTHTQRGVLPVGKHSLFRMGGMSDLITAHVLARLVVDGRIRLDEPLNTYLPTKKKIPACESDITLLDLATHTSGLADFPRTQYHPAKWRGGALFSLLINMQHPRPPGSRYEHSSFGYALLNHILVRVAKTPMEHLMSSIAQRPLHLEDTMYSLKKSDNQPVCFGYFQEEELAPHHFEYRNKAGYDALGLYSSIADMQTLLRFHIQSTESVARVMHTPRRHFDAHTAAALGFFIRDGNYTMSGSAFGFSAYLCFNKERAKGVVVLLNKEDAPIERIGSELFELL